MFSSLAGGSVSSFGGGGTGRLLIFSNKKQEESSSEQQHKINKKVVNRFMFIMQYKQKLFPFDCSRRLGADIINDAVNALYLVDDIVGNLR